MSDTDTIYVSKGQGMKQTWVTKEGTEAKIKAYQNYNNIIIKDSDEPLYIIDGKAVKSHYLKISILMTSNP